MSLLIFFSLIAVSAFSQIQKDHSSYCSDVRLDQGDGVMSRMKETVQQSGTCYAHASVQIYDAWRFSHLKKGYTIKQSSPASAAYIYKKSATRADLQKQGLDGGEIKKLLNTLKADPPCPIVKTKIDGTDADGDLLEGDFNYLWEGFDELKTRLEKTKVRDSLKIKKAYVSYCSDMNNSTLKLQSQTKSFKDIVNVVKNNQTYKVLKDAKYFECIRKNKAPSYEVKSIEKSYPLYNVEFERSIAKRLDQKPIGSAQPIGISYCSNKAYGIKGIVDKDGKEDSCGPHGAVIIGKRIDSKTKKCQFLVLDSSLDSSISTKYTVHTNSKSQKVWIDAKSLVTHTFQMNYLTK